MYCMFEPVICFPLLEKTYDGSRLFGWRMYDGFKPVLGYPLFWKMYTWFEPIICSPLLQRMFFSEEHMIGLSGLKIFHMLSTVGENVWTKNV